MSLFLIISESRVHNADYMSAVHPALFYAFRFQTIRMNDKQIAKV